MRASTKTVGQMPTLCWFLSSGL